MKPKRIYIAGPYSKGDVVMNLRAVILVADKLAQAGHFPFIPHLSHFWHLLCPHDYEFWIGQGLAWLEVCDYVLRLPGESIGADREVERAKELDIPVLFMIDGLPYLFREGQYKLWLEEKTNDIVFCR